MRRLRLAALAAVLALVPALGAMGQTNEGEVIVVHGVPDLTVDIYVNGELTLEDFEYGDVTGPWLCQRAATTSSTGCCS